MLRVAGYENSCRMKISSCFKHRSRERHGVYSNVQHLVASFAKPTAFRIKKRGSCEKHEPLGQTRYLQDEAQGSLGCYSRGCCWRAAR